MFGEKDIHAPYREEEDSDEETLLRDLPSDHPENQDTGSQNQRSDLADTFNLFKSYLDNKLESLKEELSCSGNDLENLTKTIKKEVSVKFKNEGNKIQYNFNAELLGDLKKTAKVCLRFFFPRHHFSTHHQTH